MCLMKWYRSIQMRPVTEISNMWLLCFQTHILVFKLVKEESSIYIFGFIEMWIQNVSTSTFSFQIDEKNRIFIMVTSSLYFITNYADEIFNVRRRLFDFQGEGDGYILKTNNLVLEEL